MILTQEELNMLPPDARARYTGTGANSAEPAKPLISETRKQLEVDHASKEMLDSLLQELEDKVHDQVAPILRKFNEAHLGVAAGYQFTLRINDGEHEFKGTVASSNFNKLVNGIRKIRALVARAA